MTDARKLSSHTAQVAQSDDGLWIGRILEHIPGHGTHIAAMFTGYHSRSVLLEVMSNHQNQLVTQWETVNIE